MSGKPSDNGELVFLSSSILSEDIIEIGNSSRIGMRSKEGAPEGTVDSSIHLKLFELFITEDSDEECARQVHSAVGEGANVNASILTVANLFEHANENRERLVSDFDKLLTQCKVIGEEVQLVTLNPPTTHEAINDFEKKISTFEETIISLEQIKLNINAVDALISDINKCYTPMHMAALRGTVQIIEALFAHNVDAGAIALRVTKEEYEAKISDIHGAIPYENIVGLLMLSRSIEDVRDKKAILSLIDQNIMITPMMLACCAAQTEAVEHLLDHGVHLDQWSAEIYNSRIILSDQDRFELPKWLAIHATILGDSNHQVFIEAFKNLLPNPDEMPSSLSDLIRENPELSVIGLNSDM